MSRLGDDDRWAITGACRANLNGQSGGWWLVRQGRIKFAPIVRMAEPKQSPPGAHRIAVPLAIDTHPDEPPKDLAGAPNRQIEAAPHQVAGAIDDAVVLRERDSLTPLTSRNREQGRRGVGTPREWDARVLGAASRTAERKHS